MKFKVGDMVRCIDNKGGGKRIEDYLHVGQVYKVIRAFSIYGTNRLEIPGKHNWYLNETRFVLAEKALIIKNIVDTANKGRRAANILLKRYADKVTVKNGKYVIKEKRND